MIALSVMLILSGIVSANISPGVTIGQLTDNIGDAIISILGLNPATVERYSTYNDAGATAVDNGNDITASITTVGLPVSTDMVGSKIVTYSVTGSNGNPVSKSRTVSIIDTISPEEVTNLVASNIGTTSFDLTWNNPSNNLDFISAVVTVTQKDVIKPIINMKRVYGESLEVTDLTPGTTYNVRVQTEDDQPSTINLCQKTINEGNSWGVCNPSDTTIGQGTFTYSTNGDVMDFTASATSPVSIDGTGFSLIYYKDSDASHILPSTKPVNVLATSIAVGNTVSFSGTWSEGAIPATDDINPKGKIWMVKSSEINPDGTLAWTGYANGVMMQNYLFESDSIAQTSTDGLTVQHRMGGIVFDYFVT